MLARYSICGIVAASLAACAPTLYWANPAKTTDQFYQENSRCMAMSASAGGSNNQVYYTGDNPYLQGYNNGVAMAAADNQQAIYQQCMFGNGWRLTKKQKG